MYGTFIVTCLIVWHSKYQTSIDWPYTETVFSYKKIRRRIWDGSPRDTGNNRQIPELIVGRNARGPPGTTSSHDLERHHRCRSATRSCFSQQVHSLPCRTGGQSASRSASVGFLIFKNKWAECRSVRNNGTCTETGYAWQRQGAGLDQSTIIRSSSVSTAGPGERHSKAIVAARLTATAKPACLSASRRPESLGCTVTRDAQLARFFDQSEECFLTCT